MKYPIYCIHGDDPCLLDDIVMQTENTLRTMGFNRRELFLVENVFDWEAISQQLFHVSLFDEKRLIQLRLTTTKFSPAAVQCILAYLAHPQTDVAFLLVTPKLDTRQQKTDWFKTIGRIGKVIPIYPLSAKRFPDWIKTQAEHFGIKLTPEALSLLWTTTENNALAAKQYLAYAALAFPSSCIDEENLLSLMTAQSQYTVYSLIDAIQQKNLPVIDHIFMRLKEANTEPTLVLWSLTKIIREKNIKKAKKIAANIDRIIKGANLGKPWQALHALSLRLGA